MCVCVCVLHKPAGFQSCSLHRLLARHPEVAQLQYVLFRHLIQKTDAVRLYCSSQLKSYDPSHQMAERQKGKRCLEFYVIVLYMSI